MSRRTRTPRLPAGRATVLDRVRRAASRLAAITPLRLSVATTTAGLTLVVPACIPSQGAVSMGVSLGPKTPKDAAVIIDEQYIGPVGYIAARGVRLPVGEHRITVRKEGYFPYDRLVVADREPITLDVELVPIPD